MANVYVIASNEDKPEAKRVMAALVSKGHSVHDWTIRRPEQSFETKIREDNNALFKSEYVIVVKASRVSPGKYMELGECRAWRKNVIFLKEKAIGVLNDFGRVRNTIDEIDSLIKDKVRCK